MTEVAECGSVAGGVGAELVKRTNDDNNAHAPSGCCVS